MQQFRDGINAIPTDKLAQLTAEQWINIGAQLAADCVFGKDCRKIYNKKYN